ncbi:hypothetical protein [Haloarcula argentinensis]|uniref:DUF8162 domain-containing protein n=1 Tax=Haloarcula argentinensis TaxID=43776 RepID=A0A847UQW1_HALAR|nr:hypothetical protein [Haloarcula argentinensis]NLV13968.1 hypothetical protein [Haloarcula argentinensis]
MIISELGVVAAFVALVLLFWSPLLAMKHLRELFRWPTSWLLVNYLLIGTGIIVVQTVSYFVIMLLVAGTGTVTGSDAVGIVGGILAADLLLPGAIALASLRILPARGYWTPNGDGVSGRIDLGIGVIWYAIITSVLFGFFGLVLMFVNMPM